MVLLAVSLTSLLAAGNYLLHRDVMYPGFLQATLWLVAFVLLALMQEMFIPVTDGTLWILIGGVAFFSMGAFVGSHTHKPYLARNYLTKGTLPSPRAIAILSVIVVVGLVLYAQRAQQLASSGPSENPFVNLRYAVSIVPEETGGFGIAQYFMGPAYVLVAITLLMRYGLRESTIPRGAVIIVGLTGLLFGVLSSGRGPVLTLIVLALAIPTVLRARAPTKTLGALVVFSAMLFAVVGLALGKGGTLGNTAGENWVTLQESFFTYALAPIPSLSTFLQNRGPEVDVGLNSMRSVVAVLHAVGFGVNAAPVVQPYIDVPMLSNVYTVHQPYIKDFGALGGAVALFILGFLHSILYKRATTQNPHGLFVFLYAMSLFPLVMQVFQDMYLTLLSMWVQYTVYGTLMFVVFSEKTKWTWFGHGRDTLATQDVR